MSCAMTAPVHLDPRALAAFGLDGIGAVVVNPAGLTLQVRPDGGLDPWPPAGFRSIAADPCAGRPVL